jgi:hypothetical protein
VPHFSEAGCVAAGDDDVIEDPKCRPIVVAMLTSFAMDKRFFDDLKVHDHLLKPVKAESLMDLVTRYATIAVRVLDPVGVVTTPLSPTTFQIQIGLQYIGSSSLGRNSRGNSLPALGVSVSPSTALMTAKRLRPSTRGVEVKARLLPELLFRLNKSHLCAPSK